MIRATKIITAAIVLLTATGVHNLQAKETENTNENQLLQTISNDNKISKSDARKIMKEFLKSKKATKKLRIGKIDKLRNTWKVRVTSSSKIPVLTAYVDDKTGEITFKR